MEPTHFQIYALSHVKSNRKKSCSSRKNLTQNRSPKEGQDGVRHENEKEIDRRNGQTLLHGKQEAQDENHRRVHRNHRLQPKIRHPHPQKQRTYKNNTLQQCREKERTDHQKAA